jgi:predicted GIY-YIG superfamily endonuclease
MWVVYIVECADRSLYTGITNDLEQRMAAHETGKGAKYTKHRRPLTLRYTETADSKGDALRREAAIKALDRATKLTLIAANNGQAAEHVPPSKTGH